jgi:hypothetical protein
MLAAPCCYGSWFAPLFSLASASKAGMENKKLTDANLNRCLGKNRLAVFLAAILIALGLVLQWAELLFARITAHNTWLFTTLFGEIWNIIDLSLSVIQWHQNLYYWPLLLVIIGAAILFSRSQKVRSQ